MIQRIQSVWLLVAGLFAFLTYELPFWLTHQKDGSIHKFLTNTSDSLLIYITVILLMILSVGTIFLFKNRPLQLRLCLLGIVVSVGLLILEYKDAVDDKNSPNFTQGSWQPGIILPILIIIALFLAIRGIRKDQKLVKSLDRLR